MSVGGLVLGLINIAIAVVILLLVGAIVLWFCAWLKFPVPELVQRLYIAIVALVALYMLVALLLGLPTWRVIGSSQPHRSEIPIGGTIPAPPSIMVDERRG